MGVLGVKPSTLESDGAVSEATVRQIAEGVARTCCSDCSVATSGIAGLGGRSDEKPVGTVWIAAHTPEQTVARLFRFSGDRTAVIDRASAAAINLLCSLL